MESEQFDRLARASVGEPTRRTLVRGLAAVLGGMGVTAAADLDSRAGKSKKKKQQQKKKKQEQREKKKYECDADGKVCAAPISPCQTVACEKNKCVTSDILGGKACEGVCIQSNQCCMDNDCPAGEACGPQHACTVAICTTDAECGPNGCSCTQPNRDEVPGTGFCQARKFTQAFANSADGWFAMLDQDNTWYEPTTDDTILVANKRAVLKAANAYTPDFDKTAMSPLGGRTDVFPTGGWDVSLDIFLDPEITTAFRRFAYSAAADNTSCGHLRDFIFHVGVNAAGNAMCVAANHNAQPGNVDVCTLAQAVNLTAAAAESGWYRFDHRFRNVGGVLEVELELTDLDNGGGSVFTRILETSDPIGSTGGSRYAFVPFNNYAEGVQIRNSQRENQN